MDRFEIFDEFIEHLEAFCDDLIFINRIEELGDVNHCNTEKMLQDYFEEHLEDFATDGEFEKIENLEAAFDHMSPVEAFEVGLMSYNFSPELPYYSIDNRGRIVSHQEPFAKYEEYAKELTEYLNDCGPLLRYIDYIEDENGTAARGYVFFVCGSSVGSDFYNDDDEDGAASFVKKYITFAQMFLGDFEEIEEGILKFKNDIFLQYEILN